jgi:hypothetical protein
VRSENGELGLGLALLEKDNMIFTAWHSNCQYLPDHTVHLDFLAEECRPRPVDLIPAGQKSGVASKLARVDWVTGR